MELKEIKDKIAIIKNTKDIENIEEILSYGDLGTKINEVLNAVLGLNLTKNLDFASQQLIGFRIGKWDSIVELIVSMGLKQNEWKKLKTDYPIQLDAEDIEKVNEYFTNTNITQSLRL